MKVIEACGKDAKGDITSRPVMIPEVLEASPELLRDAVRATMQASWKRLLPALDQRLETLEADDLRFLLILSACYYSLGRMQGILEERLKGETNG